VELPLDSDPVKDTGGTPTVVFPKKRRIKFYVARYLRFGRKREWKMGLNETEFNAIGQEVVDHPNASAEESRVEVARRFDQALARKLEAARQLNVFTIDERSRWFEGACGLLLAQIAFWIVAASVQ
jgi:hypothetical protein